MVLLPLRFSSCLLCVSICDFRLPFTMFLFVFCLFLCH
ncbi:hypothetical protein C351_04364 [Cryptococcus neoformans c8]|nr:hypothetical protein C351_04364 [Cryptococcus neoformans var. grubii c8]